VTACHPSECLKKEKRLYRAWIEIEYKDCYLRIRAFCFNNTSKDRVLRYKLQAKRDGRSGTVNISQGSSLHIPSQEKKCLSKVTLRVSLKDHCQMTLEVYKDGKLVAEDAVFYPCILEAHGPPGVTCPFSLAKTGWVRETKRSFALSASV